MKIIIKIVLIFIFSFCIINYLRGEEAEEVEKLHFTYIGTIIGGGINKINYKNWFNDRRRTENISGTYYSGGAVLNVFVYQFIGEFSFQYIMNSSNSSPDISNQHLILNAIGKYSYFLKNNFFLTSGLGLYLDSPPANNDYDCGSGPLIVIGMIYELSREMRIFSDLIGRYGSFGLGQGSSKISYGINIGVVYKVGRI